MTKKPSGKTTGQAKSSKRGSSPRVSKGVKRAKPPPDLFSPTLGELDLYLFAAGRHELIYDKLGAHVITHEGTKGVAFAVWAPGAEKVSVVGNFNAWSGSQHQMRRLDESGIWELFIPGLKSGELYKYEIKSPGRRAFMKADPYAFYAEVPPGTSSIVYALQCRCRQQTWMGYESYDS